MKNLSTGEPLNPFSEFAVFSSYSKWQNNTIVHVFEPEKKFPQLFYKVHNAFRSHISNLDFPCIGAKASLNGNCYRFGFYTEMNSKASTAGLAFDLWSYVREQLNFGTNYATFIACFGEPSIKNEKFWEELLWAQLSSLNELDRRFHKWDSSVSNDPENPNFSFSFAETAFFVVGLHPASSRISRRFPWATLVFNIRAQFQRLRDENKFERMRETIRVRDLKLQGSLNPNLSDFGERSEARQYSGRPVEENWKCPFHKSS